MSDFKKDLVDPLVPMRLNPILSTPNNPVWEDDEREWIIDDNPDNLTVAFECFDPDTDKYGFLRNYSVVDLLRANSTEKLKLYTDQIHNTATRNESKLKIATNKKSKDLESINKKQEIEIIDPKHESKTPTPYSVMRFLTDRIGIEFVCFNSALYYFNGKKYVFLDYENAITLLMDLLESQMPLLGTTEYLNKIYDCLLKFSKIKIDEKNINKNLINLNNGIFDFATGDFYEPNPNIFIPFSVDVDFNQFNCSCPNFDRFLFESSCGDPDWITRMWEIIGYSLTNDNRAKSIFVFQGKMDSGKSLLTSFLQNLFPSNITISMDLIELQTQFGPSNLSGKTLCVCPDLNPNSLKNIAVSWLKRFSGGDNVSTPVKYRKDNLNFRAETRFILCTNHPIITENFDPAFIRRLVVLPFCHSVPLENQDKDLLGKIFAEKDAIFKKAMIYVNKLRQRNYVFTGDFKVNQRECFAHNAFTDTEYGNDNLEIIENFLFDVLSEDDKGFVSTDELYKLFLQKCNVNIPIQQFSKQCLTLGSELFPMKKVKRRISGFPNPINGFMGVKLIEE